MSLQRTQKAPPAQKALGNPYELYQQAVRIGPLRPAGDNGIYNRYDSQLQQKFVRTIEVPFKREVKVPTTSYVVQPYQATAKIPVKKMVPIETFEMVDEQYTEFEDREAVREKEVWVKTIVPERYIERVPVPKIRQVAKPITKYEEIQDFEEVKVTCEKAVPVQGYRIDQVEDTKVVEVEEVQDYELLPVPKGSIHPSGAAADLGESNPPHTHLSRSTGSVVHHPSHPRLTAVPHDMNPGAPPSWKPAWGATQRAPAQTQQQPLAAPKLWNPYVPTNSSYGRFYPQRQGEPLRRY
jgi:hypothetical protein